jgi:flagellar hook assembly protein FlgD
LVRTLVDEEKPTGQYTVSWNGTDAAGTKVASGVYFYRMEAHTGLGTGTYTATKKMVVVR